MQSEKHDTYVQRCLHDIEERIRWGKASEWSTRDFESLSERVFEATHVKLSVITLKRIWGKIRYESKPTISTLNALAQYLGYENWLRYKEVLVREEQDGVVKLQVVEMSTTQPAITLRSTGRWIVLGVLVFSISVEIYFTSFRFSARSPDPTAFSFSSRKVLETGVPNTVVFDFDASAAGEGDTVSILQSWDPRFTRRVGRQDRQHTSVYYYPGYFDARLKINNLVVRRHPLLIQSDGWLPLIETSPVPVYFKQEDLVRNGAMTLPLATIRNTGIPLQPETPWAGFYKVGDFGDLRSDDFIFETELRNDYSEGSAVCQHTELHILFEGAAMVLPLSTPGCVSELNFADVSGKKLDLSVLGVDFSQWVGVRFEVRDSAATLSVNGKEAFKMNVGVDAVRWVGMIYKFKGTGSVNFVRVSRKKDDLRYEENFEAGNQ